MEELRIWPWPEDSTLVPSVWAMPRTWSKDESDPGRSKFSPGVPSAKSSLFQCTTSAFSPGGRWGRQRAHRVPSLGGSEALRLRAEQAVSRAGLAWARGLPPIKGGVTRRSPGSQLGRSGPEGLLLPPIPLLASGLARSPRAPALPSSATFCTLSPRAGPRSRPHALLRAPTAPSVMLLITPDPDGLLLTCPPPQTQTPAKVRNRNQGCSSSEVPGPGLRLGAIVIIRVCLLNE